MMPSTSNVLLGCPANRPPGLVFGIYPGMTGAERTVAEVTDTANVSPDILIPGSHCDDPAKTKNALARLESGGRPLLIRVYLFYRDLADPVAATPVDPTVYADAGRKLDVVLCYRSINGDLPAWLAYVRRMVARFGPLADAIQITEEPNNPHAETGGDGASPNVRRAMIEGIVAAKQEARTRNLPVNVGVAFCPSFNPADDFWSDVGRQISPEYLASLDYVGLDFFPDVFRPLPLPFGRVEAAVEGILTQFRTVNLRAAGIPETVPIRVTENGWPTGNDRPPERQTEVIQSVVRTVHRLQTALNITHFEFFLLRDSDSTRPEMGYQWGLLRHDYAPKPAFEAYRQLIAELGRAPDAEPGAAPDPAGM